MTSDTTSMHGMYIHMDPINGVVEPYSIEVQDILKMKSIPSDTFLGSRCFNATVHLRKDGAHYQTTPGIGGPRGGKAPGYRQVKRVTSRLLSVLYKIHTPQNAWRFSSSDGEYIVPMSLNLPINRVAMWQWCTESSVSSDMEKWVCYESNVNDDLEEAWTNEGSDNFECVTPVGITNKRIIVNRSNAFFRQQDTENPTNQRWVRRILMEMSDVQSIRDSSLHNCPDDVCAICICNYKETPMIPRRTLPCNHMFHCACLAPIIDKRCPMCRAPFS